MLGFRGEGRKVFRCLCSRQEKAPFGAYLYGVILLLRWHDHRSRDCCLAHLLGIKLLFLLGQKRREWWLWRRSR